MLSRAEIRNAIMKDIDANPAPFYTKNLQREIASVLFNLIWQVGGNIELAARRALHGLNDKKFLKEALRTELKETDLVK